MLNWSDRVKRKGHLLILVLLCCSMAVSAQTGIYVSAAAADDSGAGTSWETAKRTLPAALGMATGTAHIYVKAGEYELPSELVIPNGVQVTGGYAIGSTGTDLSQRHNPGSNSQWGDPAYSTILSGGHTHRVATVNSGAVLEGCVVRNGRASDKGGGLLLDGGTVTHCVITGCLAFSPAGTTPAKGGGVYMNSGSLLNCVVCYNRADNGYGVAGTAGDAISNTVTQNYPVGCGTVTDYDGNEYATVVIGAQCWMRENLRVTHFADGTAVPAGTTESAATPYYYNPGSAASETRQFGLLYNLRAARHGSHDSFTDDNPSGMQGICPNGWHLPSSPEFEEMLDFLRHDAANTCGGGSDNLAKTLAVDSLWLPSTVACAIGNDRAANNLSLFSAPPSGYYDGAFNALYHQCRFWTTSRDNGVNSQCVYRGLSYNGTTLEYGHYTAEYGCSVRCVKNQ